jgi:xanthine/CO dehydrogenase XdhC/CoxF family maturation factor
VLATLYSLDDRKSLVAGTRYLVQGAAAHTTNVTDEQHQLILGAIALDAIARNESSIRHRLIDEKFDVLFSLVQPPLSVVIIGAGNDVMPLAAICNTMGWETTIADGRTNYATSARFPLATKVLLAKPSRVLEQTDTDDRTIFLLMTHNYNYDLDLLRQLVDTPTPYIGVLGPRKKTEKMIDEIMADGKTLTDGQLNKIYGPTGLDTGAENGEEIALSICAEINAVINGRSGSSLRLKDEPIHAKSFSSK